jgi:hypothetical protein
MLGSMLRSAKFLTLLKCCPGIAKKLWHLAALAFCPETGIRNGTATPEVILSVLQQDCLTMGDAST